MGTFESTIQRKEGVPMFGGALQPAHPILILVIVLIVFGPGKLTDLGESLGKSLNEFKRSVTGGGDGDVAPTATASGSTTPDGEGLRELPHREHGGQSVLRQLWREARAELAPDSSVVPR